MPDNAASAKITADFFASMTSMLFDKIPIPINFLDASGNIIFMNKAFLDFLNLDLDKVKGKHITEIDPTVRLPIVMKTGKPEIGVKHIFKDGRRAIVHRIPLFYKDILVGGVGIILIKDFQYIYDLGLEHEMIKSFKKNSNFQPDYYKAKYSLDDIITIAPQGKKCKKLANSYAQTDFPVLISGESGVGKELFAHAIHNASGRREGPFIRLNCGAIPENLIESELFGYEKGAFTGADKNGKKGKFELAHGGTLFLDEIGDLPPLVQVKILRALQEKEIERIGGNKIILVDVRVIAASNKNLAEEVKKGSFRQDLFYRLYVLHLHIPSLKERKGDIPLLIENFNTMLHHKYEIFKIFPNYVKEALSNYSWPGNIRELKNIIERMIVTCEKKEVSLDDIPDYISKQLRTAQLENFTKEENFDELTLNEAISHVEKKIITETLQKFSGNKAKTAKKLGIPRMSLYRKLEKYSID